MALGHQCGLGFHSVSDVAAETSTGDLCHGSLLQACSETSGIPGAVQPQFLHPQGDGNYDRIAKHRGGQDRSKAAVDLLFYHIVHLSCGPAECRILVAPR